MWFSSRLIGLAALILAVVPVRQAGAMEPEVREIVIRPAGPPCPALKYRLLPPLSDQAPGLAAPLYAQAFLAMQERRSTRLPGKVAGEVAEHAAGGTAEKEIATVLAQMAAVLEMRGSGGAATQVRLGLDAPELCANPSNASDPSDGISYLDASARSAHPAPDPRRGPRGSYPFVPDRLCHGPALRRAAHGAQRGGLECAHRDYEPPDDRFDPIAGIAKPVLGHHCAARADG